MVGVGGGGAPPAPVFSRGGGLADGVSDSAPQATGRPPRPLVAATPADERMAEVGRLFLEQAARILADQHPANRVLIRGFGRYPEVPSMRQVYGLDPVGIAGYPMYRGIARVVGMETPDTDWAVDAELDLLAARWASGAQDFFYVHVKKTDSAGEDGDFDKKVHLLEDVDERLPRILDLEPEVLIVTGDHSTPSTMRSHSWHPVPVVVISPRALADSSALFTERSCVRGTLGQIPSTCLMALALAHAGRLAKFGA